MHKTFINEDWLMTIKKDKEIIKFIFSELPRTPEVGNDDFTIVLAKDNMTLYGRGDGYGVFREMLYKMEKMKIIEPILGGWTINNQEEVAFFIFYFFANDEKVNVFLSVYSDLKNALEDSWEYMSREERYDIVENIITKGNP